MPVTIRASKDGETIETVRIGPTATVAKARGLFKTGWKILGLYFREPQAIIEISRGSRAAACG
jgi:hypothetical protein